MKRNQETYPMVCNQWMLVLTLALALAPIAAAQQPAQAPKPDAQPAQAAAEKADAPADAQPAEPDKSDAPAPAEPDKTDAPAPAEKPAEPAKPKTILFQYEGVDYTDVVREFAQFVGKPIIGDINITGKLTFFDSEPYSLEEAWDTINLMLSYRGFQLMPSESGRHLELVPMKEVSKKTRIILDLERAGKLRPGEIITAVVPLQYIDADSAA
ncbi:MAG: hypothetical protein ACOCZE_08695, partial [Planctomycetota bacterium]